MRESLWGIWPELRLEVLDSEAVMNDLEMTRLCAEAMGYRLDTVENYCYLMSGQEWKPLRDDAQAMALVKRFGLQINYYSQDARWSVYDDESIQEEDDRIAYSFNSDLNRAIVECVAKMQAAAVRLEVSPTDTGVDHVLLLRR